MDDFDAQDGRRVRSGGHAVPPQGPAVHAPGSRLARECLWREHRRTRVLIADPAGQLRHQAQSPLELAGLKVDAAQDGKRAMAMASRADYGLVLVDLGMPDSGAFELARRLRALPSRRRTPLLGVCAHGTAGLRQRCGEAGFDDCIAAPFSPETLFAAALRLLRQPALQPAA